MTAASRPPELGLIPTAPIGSHALPAIYLMALERIRAGDVGERPPGDAGGRLRGTARSQSAAAAPVGLSEAGSYSSGRRRSTTIVTSSCGLTGVCLIRPSINSAALARPFSPAR